MGVRVVGRGNHKTLWGEKKEKGGVQDMIGKIKYLYSVCFPKCWKCKE